MDEQRKPARCRKRHILYDNDGDAIIRQEVSPGCRQRARRWGVSESLDGR